MSCAVCACVSEADGLSPMGTSWYRFITESRVPYLKERTVARQAKPARASTAHEQTLEKNQEIDISHRAF